LCFRSQRRNTQQVTQTGIAEEELEVFMVDGLRQVAPPAGIFVNPQPQAEWNGEQDGEQRSGRVS
jgi:hypothetical protein